MTPLQPAVAARAVTLALGSILFAGCASPPARPGPVPAAAATAPIPTPREVQTVAARGEVCETVVPLGTRLPRVVCLSEQERRSRDATALFQLETATGRSVRGR